MRGDPRPKGYIFLQDCCPPAAPKYHNLMSLLHDLCRSPAQSNAIRSISTRTSRSRRLGLDGLNTLQDAAKQRVSPVDFIHRGKIVYISEKDCGVLSTRAGWMSLHPRNNCLQVFRGRARSGPSSPYTICCVPWGPGRFRPREKQTHFGLDGLGVRANRFRPSFGCNRVDPHKILLFLGGVGFSLEEARARPARF